MNDPYLCGNSNISLTLKLTFSSKSSMTTTELSLRIQPPRNTCPFSWGLAGSEMSYCLTSPCIQLLRYRYRSSRDIKMSVTIPSQQVTAFFIPSFNVLLTDSKFDLNNKCMFAVVDGWQEQNVVETRSFYNIIVVSTKTSNLVQKSIV